MLVGRLWVDSSGRKMVSQASLLVKGHPVIPERCTARAREKANPGRRAYLASLLSMQHDRVLRSDRTSRVIANIHEWSEKARDESLDGLVYWCWGANGSFAAACR
jgi:hypothetical protein